MKVTIQRQIEFNDVVALFQILSGVPYVLYEALAFEHEKTIPFEALTILWGLASAVDVGIGVGYFARRVGIKVKIPEYLHDTGRIITALG